MAKNIMLANRDFNGIIIILYVGFVLHVASLDNKRRCFDVGEKSICFFRPNVSSVDWEIAWKTCRDLQSTLPVIPDKEVQTVLVKYLDDNFLAMPVWTAGRYTGGSEWKWNNGQTLRGEDKPSCPHSASSCPHETHAVLLQQLRYEAGYPTYSFPYICSFTGVGCSSESNDSTHWNAGCLKWEKHDKQRLNEARNKCIERGGDLATFSGQEDLQNLKRFSHIMFNNPGDKYWIGLHRKWWIWNATDVQDIKYNLPKTYDADRLDCLFITERSAWMRDYCASSKKVICQTVTTTSERPRTDGLDASPPLINLQTGIIIGAIAVVVVVIVTVVLIIVMKRTRNKRISHPSDDIPTVQYEMSTQQIQTKSVKRKSIEVDEISNHYAEIGRVNYEKNDECRDEPQTAILYAALEFDANKAIYEEPVISSQRKQEASAPMKVGALNGNGQPGSSAESPTQAAEVTIYANM